MGLRPPAQLPFEREIAQILQHPPNLATSRYHCSLPLPRAIITIMMPVTITLIVIVIMALAAIKALIADIYRLYDDTPLDFRPLHLGTLELSSGNILFRSEIEDFPSKISFNERILNGL